jgi:hypothetical protein
MRDALRVTLDVPVDGGRHATPRVVPCAMVKERHGQ